MKKLDIQNWHRLSHYDYYKNFDQPFFSISANVEITKLYHYVKKNDLSFFGMMLYAVMNTCNQIEEFKYRIRGNDVVVHDTVHPSYTVQASDNLFRFVNSYYQDNLHEFLNSVDNDIDNAKIGSGLSDDPSRDDLIYISSIPWITFTSITHPTDSKHPDSFPRISWGKFYKQNDLVYIPISVSMHHALSDGIHVGNFYQLLANFIDNIS